MEIEQVSPGRRAGRHWRWYLLALLIVGAAMIALQAAGIRLKSSTGESVQDISLSPILQGDALVKFAISNEAGAKRASYIRQAIAAYKKALPSPAAYRRIGLTKELLLKQSGISELTRIASPSANRGLTRDQKARLAREAAMWRDIFKSERLSVKQANRYTPEVENTNAGPLSKLAAAEVYQRSGQIARARDIRQQARGEALATLAAGTVLLLMMLGGGLVGIGLTVVFFTTYARELSRTQPPRIQTSVLVLSFLVFMLALLVLDSIVALTIEASEMDTSARSTQVIALLLEAGATLAAFALGLGMLHALVGRTGERISEIGLRSAALGRDILWGIGGYAAALPFFGIAVIISQVLDNTVFRNIQTPEHPLTPFFAGGSTAAFAVVFVMGAVIAPLVEETFFRGALYGALRGGMGVWLAAAVSAAIFAVGHPLPSNFLPIWVLGFVFAILREKTGSLVPSMVAHCIHNAMTIMLTRLFF
ncbi:MAG: type II CAAX endopeptidase family protein [Armatimonadota bacterium]|nr:CPBP family intramembrane metalloprotease [bacterium]